MQIDWLNPKSIIFRGKVSLASEYEVTVVTEKQDDTAVFSGLTVRIAL